MSYLGQLYDSYLDTLDKSIIKTFYIRSREKTNRKDKHYEVVIVIYSIINHSYIIYEFFVYIFNYK